ncbi:MAG: PQQ-dependent sugar dehydrogenase [Verrucomicrobiota bacterium]
MGDFSRWVGGRTEVYSIVMHPEWKQNGEVFVALFEPTSKPRQSKIVRFTLQPGSPPVLDLDSGKAIIQWSTHGHKGGDLQFGPDGYLYIPIGDGEVPAPPDLLATGQDLSDLDASILRLDVSAGDDEGRAYRIPPDNPFVAMEGARPEVWAYGLRNPWRIAFDPRDGALWVADVGWELWEMVFRIDRGGFNGGWSIVEGPQSVNPTWKRGPTPIKKPVISHSHSEATSITGGLVYRGNRLPDLKGAYVYGDWGTGKMWGLWWKDGVITRQIEVANTPHRLISFAEDASHELFYIDHADGSAFRLVPNPDWDPKGGGNRNFPRKLSETGLFGSTSDHQLAPGVYPFEIAAPMWRDHARAERFVAYPGNDAARVKGKLLESPSGAVYAKTLSLEMEAGKASSARKIETQMLHFDGIEWRGYTYRWNQAQTDAELVDKAGDNAVFEIADPLAPGGKRVQRWRFHSRSECVRCHHVEFFKRHGSLNAFTLPQLAGRPSKGGGTELDRLIEQGLIEAAAREASTVALVDPCKVSETLDRRARSYLHANCAHCHKPASTGAVTMYWPIDSSAKETGAFDVAPDRGAFEISDARIVAPGHPERSTLLYRMLTTGTGRMPATGSHEVDDAGVLLLRDWIASMGRPTDEKEKQRLGDGRLETTEGAIRASLEAISMEPDKRAALADEAVQSKKQSTRDLLQRFLPPEKRRDTLGQGFDPALILSRKGDSERGGELFHSPGGPQCHTCHRVDGKGGELGPDLSGIGQRYSRDQVLEHIIKPNEFVDPAWRIHLIETHGGETHSGYVRKTDEKELHLLTPVGEKLVIGAKEVRTDQALPTSLMPTGTLDALTAGEAADLLAFLLK